MQRQMETVETLLMRFLRRGDKGTIRHLADIYLCRTKLHLLIPKNLSKSVFKSNRLSSCSSHEGGVLRDSSITR